LPGFPAGVFSEQMVFLSEAAFFLAGRTVMAQRLSGPQGRCGTISGKSLLAGAGTDHSWAAAYRASQGPQDRNTALQAGHNPFLQQHI